MPEDKDFKRIVRARMADTGERYTVARAGLRSEMGSAGTAAFKPARLAGVIAMNLPALDAWRRERPRPVPGEQPSSFGPDWELIVDAGGQLELLEPPVLKVASVKALGSGLGGVAFIVFGLHLLLPGPQGSDPDDPRPPSGDSHRASVELLQQAQAELHAQIREHLGIDVAAPTDFTTGRVRRQDGDVVLPARTGTTVLLGDGGPGGLGEQLDLSSWLTLPGGLPGRPWAAYGVVLRIERKFPTQQFPTDPPPGFTGPYHLAPVVDEAFWEATGEAFRSVAVAVDLPPWPLRQGKLRDPGSGTGQAKSWQVPV